MDSAFDTEAIRERVKFLTDNQPKHYIGVVRDNRVCTLCLSRKIANTTEILLMKRCETGAEFDEMLHNLKKYFDAEVIEEL